MKHRSNSALETSIQYTKGVGPRLAERFAARGIFTVGDALWFFPRAYEDRRSQKKISEVQVGETISLNARVLDFGAKRIGPRRQIFELLIGDDSGQIVCKWFHFNVAAFKKRFVRGNTVRVAGKVDLYRGTRQLVHPDISNFDSGARDMDGADTERDFAALIPLYPEVEGVYPRSMRRIMRRVVDSYASKAPEVLPARIVKEQGLCRLSDAIRQIHVPPADADMELFLQFRTEAHRRVVFEEFFVLQLGLALRRRSHLARQSPRYHDTQRLFDRAFDLFGFELTQAQKRVLGEIADNLCSGHPMNRLLQGDVGSGKTAIAVMAALIVAQSSGQTALMAPTEVLALQHHRSISSMFGRKTRDLRIAYLSSDIKGARRKDVMESISSGDADLVIGTQALIEDTVDFKSLGLVIVDEQHRFGVMQRAKLRAKGTTPHVLVMTATPIPRTLSMTLYGDLDVSILDQLPPGRSPVKTVLISASQLGQAYRHIRREAASGGQAYIICPLVEESEKMPLVDATRMYEDLKDGALAGLDIGLVHGRMRPEEKESVMQAFAAGSLQVLVATTVVEVGVDVPAATIMLIENAERFGLSQLHQLRGRVGRGRMGGSCYLVARSWGSKDARQRLKVMEKTNDGFIIAEQDLAIRGPGEFLGTRQSGLPVLTVGDIIRDEDILDQARKAAFELIQRDTNLESEEHRAVKKALMERWGRKLMLAQVG